MTTSLTRAWMAQNFPQFSDSANEGFICRYDPQECLQSAQFLATSNQTTVFESRRLEITREDAVFYYTMGIGSGDPRSEQIYDYGKGGFSSFCGHPDHGHFEFQAMTFELWVRTCLDWIVSEAATRPRNESFPGRSLRTRKPRVP